MPHLLVRRWLPRPRPGVPLMGRLREWLRGDDEWGRGDLPSMPPVLQPQAGSTDDGYERMQQRRRIDREKARITAAEVCRTIVASLIYAAARQEDPYGAVRFDYGPSCYRYHAGGSWRESDPNSAAYIVRGSLDAVLAVNAAAVVDELMQEAQQRQRTPGYGNEEYELWVSGSLDGVGIRVRLEGFERVVWSESDGQSVALDDATVAEVRQRVQSAAPRLSLVAVDDG